jgi:hypothetical protein
VTWLRSIEQRDQWAGVEKTGGHVRMEHDAGWKLRSPSRLAAASPSCGGLEV